MASVQSSENKEQETLLAMLVRKYNIFTSD